MTILALETSCDDTCAAVLGGDGASLSNVISSQHVHDRFGGVVPEIASRHHLEIVGAVVEQALTDADIELGDVETVAATQGPGLIGALLVGLSTGKALAAARRLPFVPVDHLQGHVAANFLPGQDGSPPLGPPFLCLIASGGHTLLALVTARDGYEVLGLTLDDAAGEAFDKGARMLGLGFPGGPALQRLAEGGDPASFSFPGSPGEIRRGAPRKAFHQGLDFSFAGLKTALLYTIRELGPERARERAADLAASYQAAIVASLIERTARALEQTGMRRLAIGGGVAANAELRRAVQELGVEVHVPPMSLCTDNAAMIASAARYARPLAYPDYLSLDAYASGEAAP
ncbi:MAG TPA: tRNA (adenosine(37)-N6)-threonylcarbamoyltransferase complex transferase subunit TsaD [Solirubrobacteraceae bacterium]|nr:tRNA (adenosine(37)-N6)-threonylcarbamoyltransferase complex transferase subunit TsaD [Solirubrobacteraceae bacterium]